MDSLDARSAAWAPELRSRLDALLNEYRASLHDCLDGLTEDEVRLRLLPSKTRADPGPTICVTPARRG